MHGRLGYVDRRCIPPVRKPDEAAQWRRAVDDHVGHDRLELEPAPKHGDGRDAVNIPAFEPDIDLGARRMRYDGGRNGLTHEFGVIAPPQRVRVEVINKLRQQRMVRLELLLRRADQARDADVVPGEAAHRRNIPSEAKRG